MAFLDPNLDELRFILDTLDSAYQPLIKPIRTYIEERRQTKTLIEIIAIDQEYLFEQAESLIGFAFIACQIYLSAKIKEIDTSGDPYTLLKNHGSLVEDKPSDVWLIYQAANYWKHKEEWFSTTNNKNIKPKQDKKMDKTLEVLEKVTETNWFTNYVCSNIFYELTQADSLLDLLPILERWRDDLINKKLG